MLSVPMDAFDIYNVTVDLHYPEMVSSYVRYPSPFPANVYTENMESSNE